MFIAVLGAAAFATFTYVIVIAYKPLSDMYSNRLLYRSYLSREEQALVEKNLSKLSRVMVMCDRVDPPGSGFLDAVKDNFANGVRYVFLVSSRATPEQVSRYERIFSNIEVAVSAEAAARAELVFTQPEGDTEIRKERLFEVHRLHQEWNDYPYICYEFSIDDSDDGDVRYLMYRGCDLGAGIAEEYVRISPETAYSLVKRAHALKGYIAAERESFVDSKAGSLDNSPPANVVPFGSRAGSR
jgi:hypothetical protein